MNTLVLLRYIALSFIQAGNLDEESDSLTSEAEGNNVQEEEESSDEETYTRHIPLVIPDALKTVLQRDFNLINEKNKVREASVI